MRFTTRAGRVLAVALATYFAAACETAFFDEQTTEQPASGSVSEPADRPSETRLAEVQIRVGRAAFDQGNLETAKELFEKAHKTAPDDARPLVGTGDVLFAERRFDEAEAAYRAAVARDPGLFEAQEGLGKALVSNRKYEEGLTAFEAALAIREDAALLNKIGVTHEMLGDGDAAQRYFRQSLALHPDGLTARNNLALSLGVSGNYDEALTEMEKVVATPGAGERHYANLAFLYGLSGRPMDQAPARVSQAAARKGWDDAFFARTREIAESGNRSAVLDLLNDRPSDLQQAPDMAAMPDMPDMPEMPAGTPETAGDGMATEPSEQPSNMESSGSYKDLKELQNSGEPIAEASTEQGMNEPAGSAEQLAMRTPPTAPRDETPGMDAAMPMAAGTGTDHGPYRVQLGAYQASKWLKVHLVRLGTKAADLLPAQRVDVAYLKNMYLVRSADIDSRDGARDLCTALRERKFDCYVSRKGTAGGGKPFDLALADNPDAVSQFVDGLPEIRSASAAETAAMTSETASDASGSVPPPPAAPMATMTAPDASTGGTATASTPSDAPDMGVQPEQTGAAQPDMTAAVQPDMSATPGSEMGEMTSPAAAPSMAGSGEYRVQLAAYRLQKHLDRGIEVLKKMAGDALPALEKLGRSETAKATSIPFRLRSAPLASEAAAKDLCLKLQQRGLECLVIRHGPKFWEPLA